MKNFCSPFFRKFKLVLKSFSLTEKTFFSFLIIILTISTFLILNNLNERFLVEIPERGGELSEGSIGSPRLINPLLAISETDRDLTSLVYSGLMRATQNNTLIPDLAEKYEVSEDNLEYTFYLKENAVFHDGTPVTADDVVFTIITAQNPELKSPKRSNWEGVSIEKVDDRKIIFRLKQTYAPFLQNMTLGILPKHIWQEVEINQFNLTIFNTEPIGSGPYKIKSLKKDKIGIPKSYTLESFENFVLGEPYIKRLSFYFAKNQTELLELYRDGKIEAIHNISPDLAQKLQLEGARIENFPSPRIFGIFFNSDEASVLNNNTVRKALDIATPKDLILEEVLAGFGSEISGPVPNYILGEKALEIETEKLSPEERLKKAEEILTEAGWEKNEEGVLILETKEEKKMLSFSIATANVPELVQAAEKVIESWKAIGVEVKLEKFESSDLNSNVIRPRKYSALLFGMIIGRDLDFYAFWHSSQRNDPGLNIAKYANIEVDKILEDLREVKEPDLISEKLLAFSKEINKDVPAVFLYTPEFIYVLPYKVKGVEIKNIITSEERFLNIHKWFIYTDKIWKIFE